MSKTFGVMQGKVHILPLRIYFADTDAASIVYHGRYIEFLERGRSEFLASLGYNVGSMEKLFNAVWVISDIQIKYCTPGFIDDVVEVTTQIQELKAATLTMKQTVQRVEGDQRSILVKASVRAAVMNVESGRPTRFDRVLHRKLTALI